MASMTATEWLTEYHALDPERERVAAMFEAANVGEESFERADTASFDLNERYRDLAHVAAEIFEHMAEVLGEERPEDEAPEIPEISGPDYSAVPEPQFPQNPSEARTCKHGNRVWFGHECGLCEESEVYQWNDDRECVKVSIGVEPEVGEWFYCTTHNYEVLGDAYVCEGYTPPPYTGGH